MYKRILVSIDGSATSGMGLDEAAKLAKVCNASLRLIHIVDPIPVTTGYEAMGRNTGREIAEIEAAAQRLLEEGRQRALASGATDVDTALVERSTARISERIVEHAITRMLPKNRLGKDMARKLRVYAGAEHPHMPQNAEVLEV